eukprot:g76604.t1
MQVSFRSLPSFELSPHLFPGGTNGSFSAAFSGCWHKSVAAKPSQYKLAQVDSPSRALSTFFFNFSLLFSTSSRLLA